MLNLGRVKKLLERGITQVEALTAWASSLRARPQCKESLDLQVPFDLRLQLKLRAQSNEHATDAKRRHNTKRDKRKTKRSQRSVPSAGVPRENRFFCLFKKYLPLGFGSLLAAVCPSAASLPATFDIGPSEGGGGGP